MSAIVKEKGLSFITADGRQAESSLGIKVSSGARQDAYSLLGLNSHPQEVALELAPGHIYYGHGGYPNRIKGWDNAAVVGQGGGQGLTNLVW